MNTALVKPSKAIKSSTSIVRAHLDAVDRARGIYLAQIKRAEADYFERIKRLTAATAEDAPETTGDGAAQPSTETTAAAAAE